jgi:hypothetical protein
MEILTIMHREQLRQHSRAIAEFMRSDVGFCHGSVETPEGTAIWFTVDDENVIVINRRTVYESVHPEMFEALFKHFACS